MKGRVAQAIMLSLVAYRRATPLVVSLSIEAKVQGSEESLPPTLALEIEHLDRVLDEAVFNSLQWTQWFRTYGSIVEDSPSLVGQIQALFDCLTISLMTLQQIKEPNALPAPTPISSVAELMTDDVSKWLGRYAPGHLFDDLEATFDGRIEQDR